MVNDVLKTYNFSFYFYLTKIRRRHLHTSVIIISKSERMESSYKPPTPSLSGRKQAVLVGGLITGSFKKYDLVLYSPVFPLAPRVHDVEINSRQAFCIICALCGSITGWLSRVQNMYTIIPPYFGHSMNICVSIPFSLHLLCTCMATRCSSSPVEIWGR